MFLTSLHFLIIDSHVHHGRGVVPHHPPVSSVLLVTCSDLVGPLVRPPKFVACRKLIQEVFFVGVKKKCIHSKNSTNYSSDGFSLHLTHNSQCSGLGQFASDGVQSLQFGSIHLTAVNGAVS